MVLERFQLIDELLADSLVLGRRHCPGWLAAFDVQEQPAVVAAVTPRYRPGPVDLGLMEGNRPAGLLVEHQKVPVHEPLVEAEATHHGLPAVVGHDEHHGVVRQHLEELSQVVIEAPVEVPEHIRVPGSRLVPRVRRVAVLPEGVMEPVRADVHEHEEIPGPGGCEVLGQPEPLLAHVEDVLGDAELVVGAEVGDVEGVPAGDLLHLVAQPRRMGIAAVGRWGEKTGHHRAADRRRRVGPGYGDDDAVQAGQARRIPQPGPAHALRGCGDQPAVTVIPPVAEAVDAEFPGRVPGHHAGPCGHGDRRDRAAKRAREPAPHQRGQRWHVVGVPVEQQARGAAVQADHRDAGRGPHRPPSPRDAGTAVRSGPSSPCRCSPGRRAAGRARRAYGTGRSRERR